MYLLDTDTIIYSLKGNISVLDNLRKHLNDTLCLCVVTLMELYYGAYKSEKIESNLAKIKLIENNFTTIGISEEVAELFGMLKSRLEKQGQILDDFELMIASTALTRNLTLVTNNTRHFIRIDGLKLENWVSASD